MTEIAHKLFYYYLLVGYKTRLYKYCIPTTPSAPSRHQVCHLVMGRGAAATHPQPLSKCQLAQCLGTTDFKRSCGRSRVRTQASKLPIQPSLQLSQMYQVPL